MHEDLRCAHNLGRLVQVTDPAQPTTDTGAPCWRLRPVHAARWAAVAPGARRARLHRADGRRVWQLPDAWLWPLTDEHIAKIIKTYRFREEEPRYARRVEMAEIEKNDFNLNISRYISTAVGEAEIDLAKTHQELVEIEQAIAAAKAKHNAFLAELGLSPLP